MSKLALSVLTAEIEAKNGWETVRSVAAGIALWKYPAPRLTRGATCKNGIQNPKAKLVK